MKLHLFIQRTEFILRNSEYADINQFIEDFKKKLQSHGYSTDLYIETKVEKECYQKYLIRLEKLNYSFWVEFRWYKCESPTMYIILPVFSIFLRRPYTEKILLKIFELLKEMNFEFIGIKIKKLYQINDMYVPPDI